MKAVLKVGVLLALMFAVLIVFGNKPYVQKARMTVKQLAGLELGDQPKGLSLFWNKRYLGSLKKKYADKPPLPDMIKLPAGSYVKGCNFKECMSYMDDFQMQPVKTTVAEFELAATEVSVEQWDVCVAFGGCDHLPVNYRWGRGDLPVLNVSWDDVQQYLKWLNSVTDGGYRLPTDAEWEYAARAGSETRYPWGDELPDCQQARLGSPSWEPKSQWQCKINGTFPVASGETNAFGFYHMIGNAAEWVQECGRLNIISSTGNGKMERREDTSAVCANRINRGGNWCTFAETVNVLHSRSYQAAHRYNRVGFRLARNK